MSQGVTCAGADAARPPATSEARYMRAKERTIRALLEVGKASDALKTARKVRDSALAQYGPASSATDGAREVLRASRARMRAAATQLHLAEEAQDVALADWAREQAAKDLQHLPCRRGAAFLGGASPPEAGPPQCSDSQA